MRKPFQCLFFSLLFIQLLPAVISAQSYYDYYKTASDEFNNKNYYGCIADVNKSIELNNSYYYSYWLKGDATYNLNQFSDALDDYSKALDYIESTEYEKKAQLYFWRAKSEESLGNYDGAINDYSNSISTYNGSHAGESYWDRGVLYNNNKNDEQAAKTDYQNALPYYSNDNKSLAILYTNIALCNYDLNEYTDLASNADKAIAADPGYYKAFYVKGLSSENSYGYEDAKKHYAKSISLFNDDDKEKIAYSYLHLGICQKDLFEYDDAIQNMNIAISKKSNFGEAIWDRANCYYDMTKYADAAADYTQAMAFYMDNNSSLTKLYRWRGKSLYYDKQYAKAETDYIKAAGLATDSIDKYYILDDLAYARLYQGKITNALATVDQAVNTYSKDDNGLSDKAFFLGINKRYKEGILIYNKLLADNDTTEQNYYRRAYYYFKTGNLTQARLDAQKVLKMADDTDFYTAIAKYFLGNGQAAITEMNAVVDKTAEEYKPGQYYNLACLYALMNRNIEALKYLNICLSKGYKSTDWIQLDMDMQGLQGKPEFIAMLKKYNIRILVKR